jgi:DNA-binding response OmpR family regulator
MSVLKDQQHTIQIGNYIIRRFDRLRVILVDDKKELKFTPIEYRLLLPLLSCGPVSDQDLVAAFSTSRLEDDLWVRDALDRHLDNVRRKFKHQRVNMSIRRITAFGYILLPHVST